MTDTASDYQAIQPATTEGLEELFDAKESTSGPEGRQRFVRNPAISLLRNDVMPNQFDALSIDALFTCFGAENRRRFADLAKKPPLWGSHKTQYQCGLMA